MQLTNGGYSLWFTVTASMNLTTTITTPPQLLRDSCVYHSKMSCFRYSRLIKLASTLLNIKQYATPLQSILVILPGPKLHWTYENFYDYIKYYTSRDLRLLQWLMLRIHLVGCDVMLCQWARVSCISVLWLLEPEKTSGTTHSLIQNHIPQDFT